MDARPPRVPLPPQMRETGVLAVLRAPDIGRYAPVFEALEAGGVRSVEVTLTTPGVLAELPRLTETFGERLEIGVGTITRPDEATAAIDCGARYVVTPATDTTIVRLANERGVAAIPGGLTPTELSAGWAAGASAVKLFPASTVGPDYLGHLRGPFPEMAVLPSGGIRIDDAANWLRAGAVALSVGSPLLGDVFSGGSLQALTARARQLRTLVDDARASRQTPHAH